MGYFARIQNQRVMEVVQADCTLEALKKRYHPSLVWAEASASVHDNMTYANGQYSPPQQLQQSQGSGSGLTATLNVKL